MVGISASPLPADAGSSFAGLTVPDQETHIARPFQIPAVAREYKSSVRAVSLSSEAM